MKKNATGKGLAGALIEQRANAIHKTTFIRKFRAEAQACCDMVRAGASQKQHGLDLFGGPSWNAVTATMASPPENREQVDLIKPVKLVHREGEGRPADSAISANDHLLVRLLRSLMQKPGIKRPWDKTAGRLSASPSGHAILASAPWTTRPLHLSRLLHPSAHFRIHGSGRHGQSLRSFI